MDLIGLVKILLGVVDKGLDLAILNKLSGYLDQYEENEKEIAGEESLWPNWDDSKMSALLDERSRLRDAMETQGKLFQLAPKP